MFEYKRGVPAQRHRALKQCWVVRRHEMTRLSDGKVLARRLAIWAWIDMATGRPCRIPSEVSAFYSS